MKLSDIIARLTAVETEMRGIYDGAETAGEDLTGEKLERWNALKTEKTDLDAKRERAETRDAIDRKADAKPLDESGEEQAAYGLTPEQRMADFHHARTGQDCRNLSLGRVIRGMFTGKWDDADAELRVMGSVPSTAGGFLIPTPISTNILDLVRNASVMVQAGALTVPMETNNLTLVRVLGDPTAAFRGEGQTITESDGSFGALALTARSVAALVRVNAELMDDAPMFAAILDNMLAQALALKMDYAALYGAGVGEFLGLRNTTGLNEVEMGNNGVAPADYDKWLDVMQAIEEDNGVATTIIQAPRTKYKQAKIKTGISGDLTKLTPPAAFAALRKLSSNQISITETQGSSNVASTDFFGGFQHTAFAMRQQITIEASKAAGTAFEKNQVMVRAIARADFGTFQPSQLGRLIGIL
ncbi:phage major capsid protein [Dongia sp.]|uniref:phage major capsid protein n=1 Tax=Dongia sp. TaxID=1977262 RepID=UPI0035B2B484